MPSDVAAVRGVLVWALRLAAVALIAFGVYLISARVVFSAVLNAGGFMGGIRTWGGDIGAVASGHGWVRGWPMLAIGVAFALASRPIARWIVRVPDTTCPGCGYDGEITNQSTDRCPECGLKGVRPTPH